MTREEAIEALKNDIHNAKVAGYQKEQYEMAIKALEQQPCEDCISRQAAIDAMSNALERVFPEHRDIAERTMNKLPYVITEKTGRWKRVSIDKYIQHAMAYYKCSECGGQTIGQTEYCPNCGAKMQEVEE